MCRVGHNRPDSPLRGEFAQTLPLRLHVREVEGQRARLTGCKIDRIRLGFRLEYALDGRGSCCISRVGHIAGDPRTRLQVNPYLNIWTVVTDTRFVEVERQRLTALPGNCQLLLLADLLAFRGRVRCNHRPLLLAVRHRRNHSLSAHAVVEETAAVRIKLQVAYLPVGNTTGVVHLDVGELESRACNLDRANLNTGPTSHNQRNQRHTPHADIQEAPPSGGTYHVADSEDILRSQLQGWVQ